MKERRPAPSGEADGIIEGRNAVTEALRAGTPIDKIYLARGETDAALGHIASTARSKGVVVVECDRRKLDGMSRTHSHQGVIALAAVREYASVDDILEAARAKGEPPLIVVCDELSDPHNLGAVIRTAECAGAHGVIIPKRRSAGLTAVVAKTSAGAVSHVPVARVANLPALLKELKEAGVWVFGTAADGDRLLYDADLKGPAAIVIGSEGDGMGRLVAETCDFKVRIPMRGKLNSLNASAAAAILLYEAVRQRMVSMAARVSKSCKAGENHVQGPGRRTEYRYARRGDVLPGGDSGGVRRRRGQAAVEGGPHPLSGDAPFPAHGAVSRRAARAGQGGVFPGGPAGGSTPRSAASTGAGGAAGGQGQGVRVPR